MHGSSSIDAIANQMAGLGWTVARKTEGNEDRVEATRENGAGAMVTGELSEHGWKLRYYLIGPIENGWTSWTRVRRGPMEQLLETGRTDVRQRMMPSKCNCGKQHDATEQRALKRLDRIQAEAQAAGTKRGERRVYRCPSDARRWHLTSGMKRTTREDWICATR
ncbi:hypothetical protein [Streptomyces sp. NPDC058084]